MQKFSPQDGLDGMALLVLRLGLGWFIFVWAVNKVLTPGQYQQLVRHFDGVEIATWQVIAVAAVQIALCLAVFVGIGRVFSYSALMLMHLFTIMRRWEQFLDPFEINDNGFPVNRNVVIDLAVLAGMIALILMIRRDHFSLGGWLARHMGHWRFWM
ncbi:hypothetical protein DDZ14_03080 [Maritimibacter sp. 55A14]|uniref:DoxX family membrane protein n=1 Tax=Maritimibacter sp. 55A14 TaxID=2174844 RepID=UPI000D60747C|nr:DoxX family membrane protein [Maritimibacter sp. 55A14]PWE33668.1 hypothetical protein DDZ14_03080 [Maritimibacter sp. 55A14]